MTSKASIHVSDHLSPTSITSLKGARTGRHSLASIAPFLLLMGLIIPKLEAQQTSQDVSPALAADTERAVVRSQESRIQANSLMNEAMTKYSQHDLENAYNDAVEAIGMAPSGDSLGKERKKLVANYTLISIAYAKKLVQDGRYEDAESVAKSVLDPSINPGSKDAIRFLSDLEQPDVFNKTVTPKFAAKRDQVIELLREAQGLALSGRNEPAMKKYDEVLLIDPYNTAARKGQEAIHQSAMKYDDEAYNETRSQLLWQVDKEWERPPHKSQDRSTESVDRLQSVGGTDQIIAKLNSIIIPKIDLSDTPVSEAVEYLKQKSVEQDPSKKGVNIFLKLSSSSSSGETTAQQPATSGSLPSVNGLPSLPGTGGADNTADVTDPHVTLSLVHVPLYVALDYITKLTNLKLKIDPYAVSIVPLSETTDVLITKEYKVPPTFIPQKPVDTNSELPVQPGSSDNPPPPTRLGPRENAQEFLTSQGIDFPNGASANYIPAGSKLVVRNTRDNIDQIDALVDAVANTAPSQVDITTKFLEISQNNLQELGFDWLLGPFSVGGGVYGSGGGDGTAVNGNNYPFGNPIGSGATLSPVGGLRSGDQAITGNSVDALLAGQNGATANPAPGIFSIGGIFSDPQFQLVIRALNQKKGVDLLSAPKVTTKSGVKAKVKIIDEFIYPRQYDPPVVPQTTGGTTTISLGAGGQAVQQSQNNVSITPSFPRDFTEQDLGVTLEAKPTIGPDGYTIDLELDPKVTDFDGFINYGSPINSVGYSSKTGTLGVVQTPEATVLTTNTINQPVFSVREVNTFVTVWDGQTVVLGGLITENVQKANDKVPILGDIPWAGRLFRSEADQKIKDNLVIFVTPRILDPEGQPRRSDTEDDDEEVKPIGLPPDLNPPELNSTAAETK